LKELPSEVKAWILENNEAVNRNINNMLTRLEGIKGDKIEDYPLSFSNTIGNINFQLNSSGIETNLSQQEKEYVNQQYTNNLKLKIKDWEEETVMKSESRTEKVLAS
jgi:hypothetical protein